VFLTVLCSLAVSVYKHTKYATNQATTNKTRFLGFPRLNTNDLPCTRLTQNLPATVVTVQTLEIWQVFLHSPTLAPKQSRSHEFSAPSFFCHFPGLKLKRVRRSKPYFIQSQDLPKSYHLSTSSNGGKLSQERLQHRAPPRAGGPEPIPLPIQRHPPHCLSRPRPLLSPNIW